MGLTFVTGGARSGKSTFAEKLARSYATEVLYIATAVPFDEEMQERVRKHQAQRPAEWRTVEQYAGIGSVLREAQEPVVLLDCVTVMLSNLLFAAGLNEHQPDRMAVKAIEESIAVEIENILQAVAENPTREVIMVSNELGMGLVPAYPLGRIFRDIAGRVNQKIAAASDKVYLVVSGIPVPIKS